MTPRERDRKAGPSGRARAAATTMLVVSSLVTTVLAGSGCSVLIASRGVSSIPTVGEGSTQEEVRQLLGDPASSETRKDGTRIETFRVRRKVETLWESTFREQPPGFRGEMARYGQGALATLFLYGAPLGLPLAFDAVASGKALYDSQTKQYQLVVAFGEDDRVLYSYDRVLPPDRRFEVARRPLAERQWKELRGDGCPSWSGCFTSYVDELRRRAAVVGYPLPPAEEENIQRLLEIARDRDEGTISMGEALIGIEGRDSGRPNRSEPSRALLTELAGDAGNHAPLRSPDAPTDGR